MSESYNKRIARFQEAVNKVTYYPREKSFSNLININRSIFKGFRLIYATDNLSADVNQFSLKDIESKYPVITHFFGGGGLLFYEESLYLKTLKEGKATFPIYFSISIDTQVAEAFRCFAENKNIQENERFHSIVYLVKSCGMNFDYTFYLTEDICHTIDLNNQRPFNTIRALKLFDSLDMEAYKVNRSEPKFTESITSAGMRANDAIISFKTITQSALEKRKGLFLILLKATQLYWKYGDRNTSTSLKELLEYSMKFLGQFAKLELYFGWKLLKYANEYAFFGPIRNPSEMAIKKLNGMSWDLYMIRHQEKMASSSSKDHDFYIPLIASFDKRFQSLIKAMPIRCLLVDDETSRISTIFFDDGDFFEDLEKSMTSEMKVNLLNIDKKVERFQFSHKELIIDTELERMKSECMSYV